jgi:hypothetical protein
MKKYIIYPGYVESKNDSEMHYIDANKLISLYNIKKSECIIINKESDKIGIVESNFIQLFPLRNGNYKECIEYLLEEKQEMCNNCEFVENKKDLKILCTLHEEEYKDNKQVIFCSAKKQVEK